MKEMMQKGENEVQLRGDRFGLGDSSWVDSNPTWMVSWKMPGTWSDLGEALLQETLHEGDLGVLVDDGYGIF